MAGGFKGYNGTLNPNRDVNPADHIDGNDYTAENVPANLLYQYLCDEPFFKGREACHNCKVPCEYGKRFISKEFEAEDSMPTARGGVRLIYTAYHKKTREFIRDFYNCFDVLLFSRVVDMKAIDQSIRMGKPSGGYIWGKRNADEGNETTGCGVGQEDGDDTGCQK